MKQALFLVEKKAGEIEDGIKALRRSGVYSAEQERALFNTQAEFRTLFHTVDVSLVNKQTDEFTRKLGAIEKDIEGTFIELRSRNNYSAFLMARFGSLGIALFLIPKSRDK